MTQYPDIGQIMRLSDSYLEYLARNRKARGKLVDMRARMEAAAARRLVVVSVTPEYRFVSTVPVGEEGGEEVMYDVGCLTPVDGQ